MKVNQSWMQEGFLLQAYPFLWFEGGYGLQSVIGEMVT